MRQFDARRRDRYKKNYSKRSVNKGLKNLYVFATSITSFADDVVSFNIPKILQKIRSGSLVTRLSLF
jgi:hypothetical protein